MPIAHEALPVSLVDSVTAKVDDEEKDLAYSMYIGYTSCYILFKSTLAVTLSTKLTGNTSCATGV